MANNYSLKDFTTQIAKVFKSTDDTSVHTPHTNIDLIAASEVHLGETAFSLDVIDVTFALDTSPYSAGDVLIDTATLTSAMRVTGGKGKLVSVTLIDEDDQGIAMDLVFFKVTQSLGTKNSGPSISDTNARDVLGFVPIETTDYLDLGGVKVATKRDINLMLEANSGSTSVFVGAITRGGTPTYTASGVKAKFGIERH